MKMRFMLRAAARAGVAAAAVEKLRNGGHCTVLRVKCNCCSRWVDPDEWNPTSAVCDHCTAFLSDRAIPVSKPVRWIATGNGRTRKQTGSGVR